MEEPKEEFPEIFLEKARRSRRRSNYIKNRVPTKVLVDRFYEEPPEGWQKYNYWRLLWDTVTHAEVYTRRIHQSRSRRYTPSYGCRSQTRNLAREKKSWWEQEDENF